MMKTASTTELYNNMHLQLPLLKYAVFNFKLLHRQFGIHSTGGE